MIEKQTDEESLRLLTKVYNLSNDKIKSYYQGTLGQIVEQEDFKNFNREINEKKWRIKDTSVSNRTLTHWLKEDVMTDTRQDQTGWNHFSTLELCWIAVIERLRAYGYSIDNIRIVANSLRIHTEKIDSPYPILQFGLYKSIRWKLRTMLVVNEVGSCALADNMWGSQDFLTNPDLTDFDSFLAIKLEDLFNEANIGNISTPENDQEIYMMNNLARNLSLSNVKELKITFDEEGPKSMEITEHASKDQTLYDLKNQYPFQDITFKVHNGEVKNIVRIIKNRT